MRPLIPRLLALGARVVFIGNGKPWMAQGFDEEFGLTRAGAQVLTDPSLESFRNAGMKRSVWATLGPRALVGGVGAFLRGNRQGRTRGDPWQQGGEVVVRQGGTVAFRHIAGDASDSLPADRVLVEVEKALST